MFFSLHERRDLPGDLCNAMVEVPNNQQFPLSLQAQ
jgi:hypothetical protein